MKAAITGATAIAIVMTASMAVFAQTTERPAAPTPSPAVEAQQPATPPAPAGQPPTADQSTTLVGCVEREADYRRAQNLGKGGAAGTGVGAGNEFVLVNASTSTAAATTPTPGAPAGEPGVAGTAGSAGSAYELSGPGEGQLEQFVGRRVEVVGKMKAASSERGPAVSATVPDSPTGRPGSPATATGSPSGRPGQPTGGVDITGQDLKLKEFEVVSVREATGSCAK